MRSVCPYSAPSLVHELLIEEGIRDRLKILASGKLINADVSSKRSRLARTRSAARDSCWRSAVFRRFSATRTAVLSGSPRITPSFKEVLTSKAAGT